MIKRNTIFEILGMTYRIFSRVGMTVTFLILIAYVYPKVISEYYLTHPQNDITPLLLVIFTAIGITRLFPRLSNVRRTT